MTTPEEQAKLDKAAIDADNAAKTDLTTGTDENVGDGKELAPVKGDPFAQRKTIYKKGKDARETRISAEVEQHPDVAEAVRVAQEEADQGGSRNELDRGSNIDTNRDARAPAPVQSEESLNNEVKAPVAPLPERVKVTVLGQEFEVPRGDIDEAGGINAYQKDRAASMRLQQAAAAQAEVKAEAEKLRLEKEEFAKQRASAPASPAAKVPVSTSGAAPIHTDGAGDGADVEAQASAIAKDLYSGDPKRAQAAIAQVLKASKAPVATLDPAEVARQAAELLQKQDKAPVPAQQPVDAKLSVEIEELNAFMAQRFPDLMKDEALRGKALAKFNELKSDPANRSRRLVDIGRDAGQAVQGEGPHPRQDVKDRKQTLPPTVTGNTVHKTANQVDVPLTKSGVVEMMRKSRGLPS